MNADERENLFVQETARFALVRMPYEGVGDQPRPRLYSVVVANS